MTKKSLPSFRLEKSLWKKGYCVIGVDEVGRGALAGPLYVGAVCFEQILFNRKNLFGSELASRLKSGPVAPRSSSESEGSLRRSLAQTSTSLTNFFSQKNLLLEHNKIENLGINDSKKLSPVKRERLAKIIKKSCMAYETAYLSNKVIDKVGITKATQIAMRKAVTQVIKKLSNLEIKNKLNPNYLITQLPNYFLLIDAFYIKYLKGIGLKNQKAIIHGDEKSISIAAASIISKVERDHTMIKLGQEYPIYFWKNNKGYGTKKHIEAIKKFGKSNLHRNLFLRKIL